MFFAAVDVGDSVQQGLDAFFAFIPRLVGFLLILFIGALIGGVFLAMALAFGLGGREVAGQMLSEAYDKGQRERDTVRRDMQVGRERSMQEAEARAGNGAPSSDGPTRPLGSRGAG